MHLREMTAAFYPRFPRPASMKMPFDKRMPFGYVFSKLIRQMTETTMDEVTRKSRIMGVFDEPVQQVR